MKYGLFLIFWVAYLIGNAQIYNVKKYEIQDGLVQSQVSVILQDHLGFLWIGTGGGISRFDGKTFEDFTTKEGLINNRIIDLFEDSQNHLWISTQEGLNVFQNSAPNVLKEIDIKSRLKVFTGKNGLPGTLVKKVVESKDGHVLIGTDNGLFIIKPGNRELIFNNDTLIGNTLNMSKGLPDDNIYDVHVDRKNKVWIATKKGLVKYDLKGGALKVYNEENGLPNNRISQIDEDDYGNIWLASDVGVVKLSKAVFIDFDFKIVLQPPSNISSCTRSRMVYVDNQNKVWSACSNKVLELVNPQTIGRDLQLDQAITKIFQGNILPVNNVFQDREGNLWFATNGEGVIRFSGREFETYQQSHGLSGKSVRAVMEDNEGSIWIGTNRFVTVLKDDQGKHLEKGGKVDMVEFGAKEGLKGSVWSLFQDANQNVWIGTAKGLYMKNGNLVKTFTTEDGLGDNVVLSMKEDAEGNVWFGTFNGLSKLTYQQIKNKDFQFSNLTTDDGLIHNQVKAIHVDLMGNLWLGTREGLSVYNGIRFKNFTTKEGLPSNYINGIAEDNAGGIWVATGKGISHFDGAVFDNYSTKDGLSSDTPYLLTFDDYENLWIGTNKGLDKLVFDSKDSIISIKHYGALEGFIGVEANANAVVKDRYGDLWFGTINGAIKLNLQYEKLNYTKPITHISSFKVFFKEHDMQENLELEHDQNHITFEFKALSLTVPEKTFYKFQLEGFDDKVMQPTQRNYTTYSNLSPGEYTFKVWACNDDQLWNTEPTTYSFTILKPIYKTTWFILLSSVLGVFLIYIVIGWRIRALEKNRNELEKIVNERTHQLKVQNEKLESAFSEIEIQRDEIATKNKDIMDSIHYAKHLQDAMLPDPKQMRHLLGDYFVFNQPKDVVSGDFYWLNVVEGKTIFSVVDCTGHGVPGAFMSIVANGLLNRATNEFRHQEPADILNTVNELSMLTIQSKSEDTDQRDGMDLALCSLDDNRVLTYSGAYNPILLVQNGELITLKTDKIPIGLNLEDDWKSYTQQQIQLNKGDTIYLFTDGFADQFGGEKGKKLKMKKFKEFILEISARSIDEQEALLKGFFNEWKHGYEQLDDVLVMGIRV